MKDIKFLEDLCNADAIASSEKEVRNVMLHYMKPYSNKVYTDNIGSIVFEKKGKKNGPKIMLASHIDEVGFKVRAISEEGKILVKQIGHVMNLSKFFQPVRITTLDGKKIKGILNSSYTEKQDIKKMPGTTYVDIGASCKKEVDKLGVAVGNMVCFDSEFKKMDIKGSYCAKAFDDRIGCYILGRVLKNLKSTCHPNNLYFVGTSSEEVGVRGAETSAYLVNPDISLILDTTIYPDEFDANGIKTVKTGQGVNFTFSDAGLETNQKLLDLVIETTKKLKKQFQWDQFDGGATDAMKIHLNNAGVPSFAFCVPIRLIHGSYSIANEKDIEDTIDIVTELVKNFDEKVYKKCINFL